MRSEFMCMGRYEISHLFHINHSYQRQTRNCYKRNVWEVSTKGI